MEKSFNIWNSSKRKVRCIKGPRLLFFWEPSKPLRNRTYTVDKVEMAAWYTMVYLAEFPGVAFNSADFKEVNPYTVEGNEVDLVSQLEPLHLPIVLVAGRHKVDLSLYQSEIEILKTGQKFFLGRNENCQIVVSKSDENVSEFHCFIENHNGFFMLHDCSDNGTIIL